jgi:hypothetical protein
VASVPMVVEAVMASLSWAATLLPSFSSSHDVVQVVVKDDVSLQICRVSENNGLVGSIFFVLGVIAVDRNGDDSSWQYWLVGSAFSVIVLLLGIGSS